VARARGVEIVPQFVINPTCLKF